MANKITRQLRSNFAGRSTGSSHGDYYPTKGHAVSAFESELEDYDFRLSCSEHVDYNGDNGRANHIIIDENDDEIGCAVFSWYRMPSGNYEFVGYIS